MVARFGSALCSIKKFCDIVVSVGDCDHEWRALVACAYFVHIGFGFEEELSLRRRVRCVPRGEAASRRPSRLQLLERARPPPAPARPPPPPPAPAAGSCYRLVRPCSGPQPPGSGCRLRRMPKSCKFHDRRGHGGIGSARDQKFNCRGLDCFRPRRRAAFRRAAYSFALMAAP